MSPPDDRGPRSTLWERLVGDVDRIGWWTLPAFLAVGLAGAVMAGALAVVYYSQQVSALEDETREAREDLQAGVEDVERAREEALAEIDDRVEAVRDALADEAPVEDLATLGLVVVEARVNSPAPESATVDPDPPPPGDDGEAAGAPDVLAQEQPTDTETTSEPAPTEQPDPTTEPAEPPPPPEPPPIRPRLGVGFAVAFEDGVTFVATSHALVADPDARAGVVEEVIVTTMNGDRSSGVVHSWDEARGLALVRVAAGELPIADWRPRTAPVEPGDPLTVAGLTPKGQPVTVAGTVVLADVEAVVAALPAIDFLRGAPVVDRTGRVVAVYTPEYRPFGAGAGDGQGLAPVGLFCERMLTGCESLEAEATDPPEDEAS